MATITQKITNFPTAPDSSNDTPTDFNTHADAFVNHQSGVYVGEVNAWATQANAVRDDINGIAGSIAVGQINNATISNTNTFSNKFIVDNNYGIISGGNASTKWTKFPDGTLMMQGNSSSDSAGNKTVFFASLFKDGTPYALTTDIISTSSQRTINVTTKNHNAFIVVIKDLTGKGINAPFNWIALGRWK